MRDKIANGEYLLEHSFKNQAMKSIRNISNVAYVFTFYSIHFVFSRKIKPRNWRINTRRKCPVTEKERKYLQNVPSEWKGLLNTEFDKGKNKTHA